MHFLDTKEFPEQYSRLKLVFNALLIAIRWVFVGAAAVSRFM